MKMANKKLLDFYDNFIFPFTDSRLISWLPTMIFPRSCYLKTLLFRIHCDGKTISKYILKKWKNNFLSMWDQSFLDFSPRFVE